MKKRVISISSLEFEIQRLELNYPTLHAERIKVLKEKLNELKEKHHVRHIQRRSG